MRAATTRTLSLAACLAITGAVAADPARISVDNPGVAEGDSGTATLHFTLTRSGDTGSAVALGYQTDDDTARAPDDYVSLAPSVLTLAPGQTAAIVPVTINGDTEIEGDETMFLHLTFALSYVAAAPFDAGDGATAVTALEVNGDDRPDLAVANAGSDSVSVLLNTTASGAGVPGYATAGTFTAGKNPAAVTATDANGDGRPDLAVANRGGDDVSVLLNTTAPGADTASYAAARAFAAGDDPRSVVATDVNGDGRPDLAVANAGGDSASVLLTRPPVLDAGEGTGTLRNDDARTTPDEFRFEDQADVELDAVITSGAVTINGIGAAARIEVSGGQYSVDCTSSFRTSAGTIANGRTVCVRHTSSAEFSAATDTQLTVGGISDTFTSITLGADTTPDAFAFTDVRDALLNSPQVSDSVTLRGFRRSAPISVAGGEYSPGCTATFTSAAGTIAPGETVCVRHTSSAAHATATHTTLTVGGVSDTFTSTTPAAQDFSKTGAPALPDLLLGLLAALGVARRRAKKIRSPGCPGERIP